MGPDFACSQVTPTCVIEPTSMLIPSWVTSLGRDNFKGLSMNMVESLVPVSPNQSIPGCTPDDSCYQEVYYSFESFSGQDGWDQFSLDDCMGLIGQGQSHSLSNCLDLKNQEWFPLSSTHASKIAPDPLNWVGLV